MAHPITDLNVIISKPVVTPREQKSVRRVTVVVNINNRRMSPIGLKVAVAIIQLASLFGGFSIKMVR